VFIWACHWGHGISNITRSGIRRCPTQPYTGRHLLGALTELVNTTFLLTPTRISGDPARPPIHSLVLPEKSLFFIIIFFWDFPPLKPPWGHEYPYFCRSQASGSERISGGAK
jgi:hypothetical protein